MLWRLFQIALALAGLFGPSLLLWRPDMPDADKQALGFAGLALAIMLPAAVMWAYNRIRYGRATTASITDGPPVRR